MSLYKRIAADLRSKILEGSYVGGSALPEQVLLAKEYQTSRVTIQKALDILKAEGLIYSRQGSGTFVKENTNTLANLDNQIDVYDGVTASFSSQGEITSQILSFDVRFPSPLEMEKLLIPKSSAVYEINRLRFFNGEPLLLEYTIMPVEVIPRVSEEVLNSSIYHYIKHDLGLEMGLANRRIHADKPSELDQQYLDCEITDPVLEVEQVVYLISGVPFEYSKTRRRYDKGDVLMIQASKK